ncbi:MAG: hypothetical protein UW58_C0004G0035 [Candidatus Collierbacteria bacterium GW2011_GWC2_44_30]|nr:MAG: hypothetical protein UW58_C0004G0035 [Candidatus Collierbacteria bacterium GW2011_GWC2_44_30]
MKKHERGQGLVEYSLVLVLVAITVIAVLMLLGPTIGNIFSTTEGSLSTTNAQEPVVPNWVLGVGATVLTGLTFLLTNSNILPSQPQNLDEGNDPTENGQGLVEYALILVLVAIVVIAVLLLLGPIIGNVFSSIEETLPPTPPTESFQEPLIPFWVFGFAVLIVLPIQPSNSDESEKDEADEA